MKNLNNKINEYRGNYVEHVAIGIVQTTVDSNLAWPKEGGGDPKMSPAQDAHAWQEICKAMRAFKDGDIAPRIIIFPELSLPRSRLLDFEKLVSSLNALVFIGVDYRLSKKHLSVKNEGVVFIPGGFWKERASKRCTRVIFGKTHPAPGEKAALSELNPPWSYVGDDKVYVFDVEKYGRVGVSICYDFMDLERAVMYRGRVHHLLVLAYNRDVGMFKSLADALSRTVFCNVIVCNTGFYGGSIAVSPYRAAYKRTLYAHSGGGLFTTQVVNLPVNGVQKALLNNNEKIFKDPPPGIMGDVNLVVKSKEL